MACVYQSLVFPIVVLVVNHWSDTDLLHLATRMATFGQVGAYEEGQKKWKQYVENLEQYLIANGVSDAGKKRAIFLSTIGPKTYKLLGSLISLSVPGEKNYEDLVKVLIMPENSYHSLFPNLKLDESNILTEVILWTNHTCCRPSQCRSQVWAARETFAAFSSTRWWSHFVWKELVVCHQTELGKNLFSKV